MPEYLSTQFIKREEISRHTTRSSKMLNILVFETASDLRTFYYRTVSIWNSMDSYLRTFKSVSAFKFNMESKLVIKGFYRFLIISVNNLFRILKVGFNCQISFNVVLKFQLLSLKSLLGESQ